MDMYGINADCRKVKKDLIKTYSINMLHYRSFTVNFFWIFQNYTYSVENSGTLAAEFITSPVVPMN